MIDNSVPHDDLEIHHLPQGHPAEQVIPGYDYSTGVAIALRRSLHRGLPATSRLKGLYTGSGRQLISKGLRDLHNAGVDKNVLRSLAKEVRNTYPGAYK